MPVCQAAMHRPMATTPRGTTLALLLTPRPTTSTRSGLRGWLDTGDEPR